MLRMCLCQNIVLDSVSSRNCVVDYQKLIDEETVTECPSTEKLRRLSSLGRHGPAVPYIHLTDA